MRISQVKGLHNEQYIRCLRRSSCSTRPWWKWSTNTRSCVTWTEIRYWTSYLGILGWTSSCTSISAISWNSWVCLLLYSWYSRHSLTESSGRPSASHYFVGVQDSHLFFLDPHSTRPALSLPQSSQVYPREDLDTCHTRRLRRIHIKDMDPSMLIGFLIRDESDWKDWKQRVQSTPGKPIIHILEPGGSTEGMEGTERMEALDEVEALDSESE